MIEHHIAGGIYAKTLKLNAGEGVVQHKHQYEHLSILASGTVLVTVDGKDTKVTGPCVLRVGASKHHRIVATSDNVVWYCLHAIPPELSEDRVLAEELDSALIKKG